MLVLSSLKKRRIRGNLIAVGNILKRERDASLFFLLTHDWAHWNGTKLHKGRFKLYIRKKIFSVRVVKNWNGLLMRGN